MACLDSNLAWPCPNCGAKGGHWYVGPVVPSSCVFQELPRTAAVLEEVIEGTPPVETKVLKEAEQELPPAQVETGPSAVWAPEVQAP